MVDGIVLLVDAAEGPLPADPLRAAQGARLRPARDPRDQQGRPSRRPHQRGRRRGLRAVHGPRRQATHQLDFPIVYCSGRDGWARSTSTSQGDDLGAALRRQCCSTDPGTDVHRRRPAPGVGDQPRRQPVPRPSRAVPGRRGHDREGPAGRLVPRRRHDRPHQGRRAVPHRAAHPRARRLGRPRRPRRRRRHRRDHDR